MYPVIRMSHQILRHRNDPALPLLGTHVSRHICMPWDLDLWMELNNGRTLTLYDMGRLPLGRRVGLDTALRGKGWGMTVVGVSVRYRKRIRMLDRITMHSRLIGWDERFMYLDQSMWLGDDCANQALYRSAVTGKSGIVPPRQVMEAMELPVESPPLPGWVQNWIAAEGTRPWPPQH